MRQTHENVEVIVVDDGSKDNTLEVAESYAERDSRVRVFHKENGVVSSARNLGIRKAHGEYMIFLDSDDYLEPNACEVIWKESLTHESEIIVHGGFVIPDYPKPESWKYWAVITRINSFLLIYIMYGMTNQKTFSGEQYILAIKNPETLP